ncbi:uncharacterized protein ARMOST_19589 [Armillaria ostoyae]|uniref:Uncharacterized protein n=1 Tax=Armillaria ostoyae TaxID=47428 RepID=A0A284S4Y2_ARMOS|nr:uncharacterized protein ARMOST_19589 [Armillaria ostoyae]
MNPDDLTITVTAAIGGACLLSLLVSLFVLTYADQLRRLLRIRPLRPPRPARLPPHYVFPYLQPGPLMERVGPQPTYPSTSRRMTYHRNSSDESLPRNATPGPSNVPRTPPPLPILPRRLLTMGGTYRLGTIPLPQSLYASQSPYTPRPPSIPGLRTPKPRYAVSSPKILFPIPATPVQYGLAPPTKNLPSPPSSSAPAPSESQPPPISAPIPMRIVTPMPQIPEETNPSPNERMTTPSTHMEGITSGPNSPQSTESSSGHTVHRPGSSDGSILSSGARSKPLTPESRWPITLLSPTQHHSHDMAEMQPWRPTFSPTEIAQNVQPPPVTHYMTFAPTLMPSSENWLTTYSHWLSQRETIPTWTEQPDFDQFHYDPETFGNYPAEVYDEDMDDYVPAQSYGYGKAGELDDVALWAQGVDRIVPCFQNNFYNAPFPLLDSPNWEYQHPAPHPQRVQGYRPPQYGRHPFAGQDPSDNEQAGGSNDPPKETNKERLEKARYQSQVNHDAFNLLQQQLEAARDKMIGHDKIWQFPVNNPDNKGKKPDRGRPFVPNHRRPLHEWEDRFSVPRPPPGKGHPHPMPQPIGQAPPDAAYLGIKPILMQPPKPF